MLKTQDSYLAILLNASSSSIWSSDEKRLVIRIQSPSSFQPCLTNEKAGKLDSFSWRNVFKRTVLVTERFSKKQLLTYQKK